MRCVTPMVRIYQKLSFDEKQAIKNAGNKQYNRIIPRHEVNEKLQHNENYFTWIQRKNEELEKQNSRMRYGLIPCKKCWACRLNYSAEWAVRIMHECSKTPDKNYFVTLTYDNEHVPTLDYIKYKDKDGNEKINFNNGCFRYSLVPDDAHRFINSLRKYLERHYDHKGLKYYYCGEYGGQTQRPHYHMILMNCPLNPADFYDLHTDENGKDHWKQKEIERQWKKGMIDVALVEFADAAYVARYGTKLFLNGGTEEDYAKLGMVREFTRCSRNPAVGLDYVRNNEFDLLLTDEIIMKNSSEKAVHVPLPQYYQRKLEESYPEYIDQLKEKRQLLANNASKIKRTQTNLTDKEIYTREAQELARRGALLKRENLDRNWNERIYTGK